MRDGERVRCSAYESIAFSILLFLRIQLRLLFFFFTSEYFQHSRNFGPSHSGIVLIPFLPFNLDRRARNQFFVFKLDVKRACPSFNHAGLHRIVCSEIGGVVSCSNRERFEPDATLVYRKWRRERKNEVTIHTAWFYDRNISVYLSVDSKKAHFRS